MEAVPSLLVQHAGLAVGPHLRWDDLGEDIVDSMRALDRAGKVALEKTLLRSGEYEEWEEMIEL